MNTTAAVANNAWTPTEISPDLTQEYTAVNLVDISEQDVQGYEVDQYPNDHDQEGE